MVQKITDAGPFLDNLLYLFKHAIYLAKTKYISDIRASEAFYKSKLPDAVPAATQYLADHPVPQVAYSQDLLSLLRETRDAAILVGGNVLSEAQIGYDTMRSNANLDYSSSVSQAYDDFNFALSSAYITDASFDDKYKAIAGDTVVADATTVPPTVEFKSAMTLFIDAITTEIDSSTNSSYDDFTISYKDVRSQLNELSRSFVLNRPVVRFTGIGHKPIGGINFDADNSFGFEIENVGKASWQGNISLKVLDQYKKSVVSVPVPVTTLSPGEKRMIEVSVYIPKVDPVSGYNFGTNISTIIRFE